ncbi:cytochrome c biogenesis protein CcdA [Streptosporangium sp. NPDC020145]|uniref:cytochrome c biogenesis CcdA family protein n=1 Tax=Streptosporangium sp. NPDC020145 TaxID=3154694 RepID=UPI0034194D1C
MIETLAFALAAGALAAVNPCGFAMLPGYLALFISGPGPDGKGTGRLAVAGRALAATAAMSAGFLAVFGTFGLVLAPFASGLQRWIPVLTVVIGGVLTILGAFMLAGRSIKLPAVGSRAGLRAGRHPASSPAALFGYGLAYATASLGCTIGPFLVVTATTFRAGNIVGGLVAYLAYAAGMGAVVGVLAVSAALAKNGAARLLRRTLPHIGRLSSVLLLVSGAYVAWYGWHELQVTAGRDSADPVIDAAAKLQNTLAAWVDGLGPWTVALTVLALLVLGGLGVVAALRRRSRISTPAE